jgi:hypothetical protein
MALPELIANSSTPGTVTSLTTLSAEATEGASTIKTNAAAPAALQAAGQFRILAGSEIMLVTGGASTTTWTVTRGVEGSAKAAHASGTQLFHFLTAEALRNIAFPLLVPITKAVEYEAENGQVVEVSGEVTIKLPTPTAGRIIGVRAVIAGKVTVKATSGKIRGPKLPEATTSIGLNTLYSHALFWADGTNWNIIGGEPSPGILKVHGSVVMPHNAPGTLSKIEINTVDSDVMGWWNPLTHRYTPQTSGFYNIGVSYVDSVTALASGLAIDLGIFKNGASLPAKSDLPVRIESSNSALGAQGTGSWLVEMNGTTDYIEVWGNSTEASKTGDIGLWAVPV